MVICPFRKNKTMANIASILKDEIARVSRKEVRAETQPLKKTSAHYRSDIAALKRRVAELEKLVGRLGKTVSKKVAPSTTDAEPAGGFRFSASGLQAQRKRLGLSAAEAARLLGVSDQSVYKWENGKTRPRASQFAAIAALRSLSKKQALERLNA
jgi:DNA-binding transcriptional regulator YiaG